MFRMEFGVNATITAVCVYLESYSRLTFIATLESNSELTLRLKWKMCCIETVSDDYLLHLCAF